MDTPDKKDITPSEKPIWSMLDQILEEANKWSTQSTSSLSLENKSGNIQEPPKIENKIIKKSEPVSGALLFKFFGTIFLIALIFFGSFLAYVVFNPSQAQFFGNFGIDLNDVAILLQKLVNGIFGLIVFMTSVLWIYILFKAIWTSKELKRTKLLRWLLAGFIGIILFSLITLWAVLIQTINASDYTGGNIKLYDQELGTKGDGRYSALLTKTTELIGPIRILFDISANATTMGRKGINIESFRIDFDGARCDDGGSVVTGSNTSDKSIVCLFDKIKWYNPKWVYISRDRTWKPIETDMIFPPIEVRGLVDMKRQRNKDNKSIVTLDASSLQKVGNPIWQYENGSRVKNSITEVEWDTTKYICLMVFPGVYPDSCRWFVIGPSLNQENIGVIVASVDPGSSLSYTFDIDKITIDENQILSIEWLLDNQSIICDNKKSCVYNFTTYGKKDIQAKITLANGEEYILPYTLELQEPLKLARWLKVLDADGNKLNTDQTYDSTLRAYIIKDVSIPSTLKMDARDITPAQPGYTLDKVEWRILAKKPPPEKRIWDTLQVDILEATRYSIYATYTFSYTQWQNIKQATSQETVIIDTENRNLIPILSLDLSSDYAPATVKVDASASRASNGEIVKFIFDFWEGKEPVEGDSHQEYQYLEAGDRNITLTVVASNGEKATITKKIIIKKAERVVDFSPSIAPGIAGSEVDFTPGTIIWQVSEYIWNFGDGSPVVRTMNATHSFKNPGKYSISLTVRYSDGTQKTETKEYAVESTLIN